MAQPRQPGFHASNYAPAQQLAGRLQGEERTRNELFSGAYPAEPANGQQEETIDQLVHKAKTTHEETTQVANRALRVVEQTKQVQVETLAELENQGQKLNALNAKLNQVNQDLTYSEKLLRYMRRCCCCFLCDSCTGADPEARRSAQWEKQVDSGKTSKYDVVHKAVGPRGEYQGPAGGKGGPAGASKPNFRDDPNIRLTDQHKETEMQMNQETRKQNEILDQIHQGLGDMLTNARAMNAELDAQIAGADTLNQRFDNTNVRLQQVNQKSQLRKC